MYSNINKALEKPPLYKKTEVAFWDDEYISKQMLKAHLNPNFEGASRKLDFIDKSVAWISEIAPPAINPLLLDIGCGPGIYAEKFSKAGYTVTGVDFSKRSIAYAQTSAKEQHLTITYLYQNYLTMELQTKFDFITMIYCDYGALSTNDRKILLKKVSHHLKPHGKFLMDVFTIPKFTSFQEKQTWEICNSGGFWQEAPYVALNGYYKYANHITLEQTSIISAKDITTYYIWNTCFTQKSLYEEVSKAGFQICNIFGDAKGSPYREDSYTMAVVLEKTD